MMEIEQTHFETIDSTNNWAKLNAHLFDQNKIQLITADQQTGGRGRFNRTWVSPAFQNIYATFCFQFDIKRSDLQNIPQVLSLSTLKILKQLNFQPKIKWPNDILISNKKLAGILCETVIFEQSLTIILGIGININMSSEYFEKIDQPATSLKALSGHDFSIQEVLDLLKHQFQQDLELFLRKGFEPFVQSYLDHFFVSKGDPLSFQDGKMKIEGKFDSINLDGTINLRLENGELKRFISGEVLLQ